MLPNSEAELNCWFIENPVSKELCKSITLRMSGNAEKEFIIVLKAPSNRQFFSMCSFLTISLATRKGKNEDTEKHLKKGADSDEVSLQTIASAPKEVKQIKVMVIGRLENPTIKCLKQLNHVESGCAVVPIGIKRGVPS